MKHAERIPEHHFETVDKIDASPSARGKSPSPLPAGNLAIRLRMAEELVERGLSREAAARLLRLAPE